MYRVCLALLLLLSLRPSPVGAGTAASEAGRWHSVLEHGQQAVLGAEAAELHAWERQVVPEGSAPPTARASAPRLDPAHARRCGAVRCPPAALPSGPQNLPYHAMAPPALALQPNNLFFDPEPTHGNT